MLRRSRGAQLLRQTVACACTAGGAAPASAAEALLRIRTRDCSVKVVTKTGDCRVVFTNGSASLKEAVRRHSLVERTGRHTEFLQLLGSNITFTSLLAFLLRHDERVATRFTCDEATILCESIAAGEVRCYVKPERNADRGEAMPFPLKVDRVMYSLATPVTSVTTASLVELAGDAETERRSLSGGGADSVAGTGGVPLGLSLGGLNPEDVEAYFRSNITLHAYNHFRRSDGCVVATLFDAAVALPAVATDAEAVEVDAANTIDAQSVGLLVQPIIAGGPMEERIAQLQQALVADAVSAQDSSVSGQVVLALRQRMQSMRAPCQDYLSLVTGDFDASYEVAKRARQVVIPPAACAAAIAPLRRKLGIENLCLPIDVESTFRTSLDFMCRCSKVDFLSSLVTVPPGQLKDLKTANCFTCIYCRREHRLTPEDWTYVESRSQGDK